MKRLAGGLCLPVLIGLACSGPDPSQAWSRYRPGPAEGRRALEAALDRWRAAPSGTAAANETFRFVDQQRQPGQRLIAYTVQTDQELEGTRLYRVRLELGAPTESVLAGYYVFGTKPTWVFRQEDYEMMMHWEHVMPEPAEEAADNPKATGP
jgi:hypothetical protein